MGTEAILSCSPEIYKKINFFLNFREYYFFKKIGPNNFLFLYFDPIASFCVKIIKNAISRKLLMEASSNLQ